MADSKRIGNPGSGMSRRHLIGAGAAAAVSAAFLGGCVSPGDVRLSPEDAAALRIRSITVDVGPLVALGLTPWAGLVKSTLEPELARLFAARLTPGDKRADRLVVRVSAVTLASWAGSSSGGGRWLSGGGDTDYMEGDAIIIGPDGAERARRRILLALSSDFSGAWYLPDIDTRRVIGLSRVFAQWVRDQLVGRRG